MPGLNLRVECCVLNIAMVRWLEAPAIHTGCSQVCAGDVVPSRGDHLRDSTALDRLITQSSASILWIASLDWGPYAFGSPSSLGGRCTPQLCSHVTNCDPSFERYGIMKVRRHISRLRAEHCSMSAGPHVCLAAVR